MPDVQFSFVNIRDRPMITVDLDVPRYLRDGRWDVPADLRGAIVRVRGQATESEAEQLAAGGQRLLRAITEKLKAGGAHKVIGPKLKIVREKRVRSDVTADTDPRSALDRFLVERDVDESLRPRVIELAEAVMGR
jgi:hypothetical protein